MWRVIWAMVVKRAAACRRRWKMLFCSHKYEWPSAVTKRDEKGRFDGYRITSKCKKCGYEL